MAIREMLLPEFDEEMRNTRKILERVPDDKLDYKPHEKSMALGRLAAHVAELPAWAKHTIEMEVLDLPPVFQPYSAKSREEVLATFDKNVAEARELIVRVTDEELQKTWTLKFGGNTIFSMPRSRVLRSIVMNHLIHHRAQLGVYLRLNEVEIPGMYGPSADEMKYWNPGAPAQRAQSA
ncbi:MAG: DinB family protein [Bryobacteraceae bacterium]